tara:strand:+ start:220 stop:600 length:381 start_codon:yes stop_codon:yes gene_type:complete
MKTQSAKAKGRRLQQWVRDLLIKTFNLQEGDIESRSMGASGEDIMMSPLARSYFPYSIECKNTEKINVWKSYEQAKSNSKQFEPMLVIKRNNSKPLIIIDAEYFIQWQKDTNTTTTTNLDQKKEPQ